jgi:hypothetical protein
MGNTVFPFTLFQGFFFFFFFKSQTVRTLFQVGHACLQK